MSREPSQDDARSAGRSPVRFFARLSSTPCLAMWCPKCKTKSPPLAVGTDELICAQCRTEVTTSIPKPKSRAVRTAKPKANRDPNRSATKRHERSGSPSATPPLEPKAGKTLVKPVPTESTSVQSNEQTVASAQAVAKAWTESNRKWRVDHAHLVQPGAPADADTSALPSRNQGNSSGVARSANQEPSRFHSITFGLFVFLIGHGLTIWAFLAGHFGAWTLGSFCSVGGVAIAFVSVVQALRNLESKISGKLAQPTSTHRPSRRIRKAKRRPSKKSRV